MSKISRMNINGTIVDIDDKDAVQLPEDPTNGDILVYDAEHDKYIALSPEVAIALVNTIANVNLPVASSAVYKAINAMNSTFRGGIYSAFNEVLLEYDYKPSTHQVRARAFSKEYNSSREFILGDKLDIAVFCLDADYDQSLQTYYIGNFVGIISVDTSKFYGRDEWVDGGGSDYRYHYSGYLTIPNIDRTKILNFVVLNPVTDLGVIRKSKINSIVIPSSTAKTITISSSNVGSYESQLIFTLSQAPSTDPIDLKVTITGGRNQDYVEVKTLTIAALQSSATLNIGESGFERNINVEILDLHGNDYTIVNSNMNVSPRIPNRLLVVSFTPKYFWLQVMPNVGNSDYFSIVSHFTTYEELIQHTSTASDINVDTNDEVEVMMVNSIGSEPDVIHMHVDGAGHTKEELINDYDIDPNKIPFNGHNIHYLDSYAQRGNLWIDDLIYSNPNYDESDLPYVIRNHQQFEVWWVDENGYMVDGHEYAIKFFWNS